MTHPIDTIIHNFTVVAYKIYTKTGDKGQTSLFGGDRVPKDHALVDAYGSVDELNAHLGLLAAIIQPEELRPVIYNWQNILFDIGAMLATPPEKHEALKITPLDSSVVTDMEANIDQMEKELEPLTTFILPGGDQITAEVHICRTICRRVERKIVSLHPHLLVNPTILTFFNRFSDYLFVLARYTARLNGVKEIPWKPSPK